MNEKNKTTSDAFPDRLSTNPSSPYYNEELLSRDVGIRFKGAEKTNVEEYCISEGWVRVTAGNAKDRYGNPLTIKVHGPVEPYFRDKASSLSAVSHSSLRAKRSNPSRCAEKNGLLRAPLLAMTDIGGKRVDFQAVGLPII